MEKKQTVGSAAWSLIEGSDELQHSPYEQMLEQLEDYEANVLQAIETGKKLYDGDFYIVVETKKEPKLQNVIRNYFFPRKSCPTPTYDNAVYKYHRSSDDLEFLWVLPSKSVYYMMINHALEIPAEQKDLLDFVLADKDGILLKKCKELNGEFGLIN